MPPKISESFDNIIGLEMVPRQCALEMYSPIEVEKFRIIGDVISYASPDSAYVLTKKLLDEAKKSILIGIYDFTAEYMMDILINALNRGVTVSIMLDLDNRKGENELWEQMKKRGIKGVPAPSCASREAKYFPSCHEKVIVIDTLWTLVQSGNYTDNSIPKNEVDGCDPADPQSYVPGNRDMGIAIKSAALADFFTKIIQTDMKLQLDAMDNESPSIVPVKDPDVSLETPRPPVLPPYLFHSRQFILNEKTDVVPVLSPDNYMKIIPDFLASATKSIYIEQQYIRSTQPEIRRLLDAIQTAKEKNPDLDIQIIIALPYSPTSKQEIASINGLKEFGLKLGKNVRYLNSKFFVHCHNKLLIVDEKAVLISSQNWSDYAVIKNREAGILVFSPEIADYYASIFKGDWETGLKKLPSNKGLRSGTGLETQGMMAADIGDYVEI